MCPALLEQVAGMRQRLEDWVGIRQPVVEAEVPGFWTTRTSRGMQNPNRAKIDMCDERVCDYAKNVKDCMRAAGVHMALARSA